MLIEDLKKEKLISLKNNDNIKKNLLSVIISESCKEDKNPSDDFVISTIKKILKYAEETYSLKNSETTKEEINILNSLLPKQLSDEEILEIIMKNDFISIAQCMLWFKQNKKGLYDGKKVSHQFNKFKGN